MFILRTSLVSQLMLLNFISWIQIYTQARGLSYPSLVLSSKRQKELIHNHIWTWTYRAFISATTIFSRIKFYTTENTFLNVQACDTACSKTRADLRLRSDSSSRKSDRVHTDQMKNLKSPGILMKLMRQKYFDAAMISGQTVAMNPQNRVSLALYSITHRIGFSVKLAKI